MSAGSGGDLYPIRRWVIAAGIWFAVLTCLNAYGLYRAEVSTDSSEQTAETARVIAYELRASTRQACRRTNDVRANQYEGIEEQIKQTEESLAREGGLGPLESFRDEIEEQLVKRRERLERLVLGPEEPHQPDKPHLIDCVRAHP
jgi:hypothetical protein